MIQTVSKNALSFLARFGFSYLAFSFLYSLFLSSYQPKPDPFTTFIGQQVVVMLNLISADQSYLHVSNNHLLINFNGNDVVAVFEGCNGLIVQALFFSFFIGIWQWNKGAIQFVIWGLISIYIINLIRLTALVYIAESNETLFYYYHKYVFMAIMYLSIIVIWFHWLKDNKVGKFK
jgi:exosortase family protein XrtF